MITRCPVCGKKFDVLWPELWRYKREKRFLCSWSCLRKYDRKEAEDMKTLTDEEKRAAAEVALTGGNPLPYLKGLGVANVTTAWNTVRNWARGHLNQDEYEKLSEKFGRAPAKTMEEITEQMAEDGVELVYDPSIAEEYRREQAQKEANAKAAAESRAREEEEERTEMPGAEDEVIKEEDFFLVTAVKNKNLGEFYYDHDHNCIDWRNGIGDEVSLGVEGWKLMVRKLPGILRYLGVEV